MNRVQALEDVYPAIKELIAELRLSGNPDLAAILDHRMYQVAWTSGSELYEELQHVLTKALEAGNESLPSILKEKMQQILKIIDMYLKARKSEKL